MFTKVLALSGLLVALSACASTTSRSAPSRAPGTEPCDMTSLEHQRSAAHEERRADVARSQTTRKQGVLERQQSRREVASRPAVAAQHRDASEGASACP